MKKVNFFSAKAAYIIALFVFIFQSCKKEDKIDVSPADNDHISFLQQEVAKSIGIPADKVVYRKDEKVFVADEDSYVTLEDAKARFAVAGTDVRGEANGTNQMISYYRILPSKVNTIKLYVDPTVPSMWVQVLDSAIKNWNATGSRVFMQRVATSAESTTQVVTFYSASTTVAIAAYPDQSGNPGNRIKINTYQNSLAFKKKIFAITHELGHTLGFSHTNGTYGYLISGTPTNDYYSVMNSMCTYWTGFSAYDFKAVRTIYPR